MSKIDILLIVVRYLVGRRLPNVVHSTGSQCWETSPLDSVHGHRASIAGQSTRGVVLHMVHTPGTRSSTSICPTWILRRYSQKYYAWLIRVWGIHLSNNNIDTSTPTQWGYNVAPLAIHFAYMVKITYIGCLSSLTWIEAWFGIPLIRWYALRFLCMVIWKSDALPWLGTLWAEL